MSFPCIFHVCFLLELSKEKENYSLRARGELAPGRVPEQFLQERTPKIEESLRVFQEKLFVATHLRNSIASITINSNRLCQIAGSPNIE